MAFRIIILLLIPLFSVAQTTDVKDVQVARQKIQIGTDAAKYLNEIVQTISGASTHVQSPTAKAVWDLISTYLTVVNLTFTGTSSPVTLANSGGSDVTFTAGTGISFSASSTNITITNTATDQTVVLTAGSNISITGTYPNFTIAVTGVVTGTGTVNYFPKWDTGGASLTATSLLYDDGSEVGLNTTTPFAEFHLNNGDFGAYKNTTGSNGASLFLGDLNYDNASFYDKAPGLTAVYNSVQGVASDLGFYSYNGSRNLRAILDKEGNFGVGTATPARLLHVAGPARITGSTGTATTITGRDGNGDISNVTVGTGLTLSGGTLSNTAATYSTIQEEGTPLTQQPALNFVGSAYTATNDGANSRTNVTADADVNALANIATTGLYVVTGAGTSTTTNMNLAASTAAPGIGGSWSNANGVSGPPTLSLDFTGYTWKQYARAVSTTNITLSGLQTIDGVSLIANDRLLVTGQTTGANNGLYLVTSGAWNRAPEANASAEFSPQGQVYFVTEGTAKGNTFWYLETDNVTLGTTPLVYTQHVAGTGTLTGTLTAPRIPFASSASALTDDANLSWDNTNKRLIIGTGTSAALLNVFAGSLSGTQEFIRSSANVSGNMMTQTLNANTINSGANTINVKSTGGANAGDPYDQYIISGVGTWSAGVDNSDGDKYKIASDASLGAATATDVFQIDPNGLASIGGAAIQTAVNLTVAGTGSITVPAGTTAQRPGNTLTNIRYNSDVTGMELSTPTGNWYRMQSAQAPTVAAQAGAGTGSTATLITGSNDIDGMVNIVMGSSPSSGGVLARVTFGDAFSSSNRVFVILRGANDAAQSLEILPSSVGNSLFDIKMKTGVTAATPATYQISYHVSN